MDQEQMAAWMKYAAPGPSHEFLTKLTGRWTTRGKFWMAPGADPSESQGSSENEMILGGRFLHSRYSGEVMNSPFEGMALDGYDNLKQKYVGLWIDTMGTMMLSFEGTCDGTVREMIADVQCPMSGNVTKMKGVATLVSENEHRYESFNQGPDGEFYRSMEIVYTRQ